MTATTKKFDRSRVHVFTSPNGLVTFVNDCNRNQTAEVLDVASRGYNVRIDKGGKPFRYIQGVPVKTAEAAYEYAVKWAKEVDEDFATESLADAAKKYAA